MEKVIVQLQGITKAYQTHSVLNGLRLEVRQGEMIAVVGSSGCGKSTLLNIIGLLEKPDQGELCHFDLANVRPFSMRAQRLLKTRIGYLFQNYALLENKSVSYNLELAFDRNYSHAKRKQLIDHALQTVGLAGMSEKKVCQCSGGEQQRIALARLLLKPCELILADEPTGNLDEENKQLVFSLLQAMNAQGKTIILVTHDLSLAKQCHRQLRLQDGVLVEMNRGNDAEETGKGTVQA